MKKLELQLNNVKLQKKQQPTVPKKEFSPTNYFKGIYLNVEKIEEKPQKKVELKYKDGIPKELVYYPNFAFC